MCIFNDRRKKEPCSTSAKVVLVLVDLGIRKLLSLIPFPCPSVKLHWVIWIELALCKLNCSVH